MKNQIQIGCVVEADFGFYRHLGIVTGVNALGEPIVTSNSLARGGVQDETLRDFCGGHCVTVTEYAASAQVPMLIARINQVRGTRYSLTQWNCDHFVEWAFGRQVVSKQLRGWITLATVSIMLGLAAARA
jgi:hypothetical protein